MTRTYPLGRVVQHDPRSLQYRVRASGDVRSAYWERTAPILDQGDLGSCTGNAAAGVLGTAPFDQPGADPWGPIDEAFAVRLYGQATVLDGYPGTYPPDDTGSSGLGVAKAAKANGWISGYQHITSLAAAHTAIQSGPFIVGTNWYEKMFEPTDAGLVEPGGAVAGGHEYEAVGYDEGAGLWRFANSWGAGWGDAGQFYYTDATFARLLAEDGDATVFVPLSQPAPTPTPTPAPTPAPTPTPAPAGAWPGSVVDPWLAQRHYGATRRVATALQQYRATLT